jgi:hypothetical protein
LIVTLRLPRRNQIDHCPPELAKTRDTAGETDAHMTQDEQAVVQVPLEQEDVMRSGSAMDGYRRNDDEAPQHHLGVMPVGDHSAGRLLQSFIHQNQDQMYSGDGPTYNLPALPNTNELPLDFGTPGPNNMLVLAGDRSQGQFPNIAARVANHYGMQQPNFYGPNQALSHYAMPGLYAAHHINDMVCRGQPVNRGPMHYPQMIHDAGHLDAPNPEHTIMSFRPDDPASHYNMGQARLPAPTGEVTPRVAHVGPHGTPHTASRDLDRHMLAGYQTESFGEFFDPDGDGMEDLGSSEQ